jgi:hypothetical protein
MRWLSQRRDRSAAVLLILTGLGFLLSRSALAATAGGAILLAIAIIKARLVVLDYFGFRGAPGPWRAILIAWIALVAAAALAPSIAALLR